VLDHTKHSLISRNRMQGRDGEDGANSTDAVGGAMARRARPILRTVGVERAARRGDPPSSIIGGAL